MIFLRTEIGIKNNDKDRCTFCEVELESLTHLFWFCTITSSFWQTFKQWSINDKNFATIQDTDLIFLIIIGLRPNAFKNKKKKSSLFSNRNVFHLDLSSAILGDPGAVSGGGEKSKQARKKFGRRKVKKENKSPWGQGFNGPVPNGRNNPGF